MVWKDLSIFHFESTLSSTTRSRKVTHQLKKLVIQNGVENGWKRRGSFLITFNTPVLPEDTTKYNQSKLMQVKKN